MVPAESVIRNVSDYSKTESHIFKYIIVKIEQERLNRRH